MRTVALAGNPNVGKSTLFNALTGMEQHTGNWSGKTVAPAQGVCTFAGREYRLVDLPGTYSLVSSSPEEDTAAAYLRDGEADCTVVVCDATCPERSLILALQVIELCGNVIVCFNLIDEAEKNGISLDAPRLSGELGVPVVTVSAAKRDGLERLLLTVRDVCDGFVPMQPKRLGCGLTEDAARMHVKRAERLAQIGVHRTEREKNPTQRLDSIVLHRVWGYAVLLILLLGVFWLTIEGANYPSALLQGCFDRLGSLLRHWGRGLPAWLLSALLDGVYATSARVVAVMLPPMAIFFPLFTLLEDFGYLPRVAFLMDDGFRRAGACGKQSLTLCMGFGCNAAGVTGCRIIDSRRERLIAVLTNAFVPCNGRFPALIFLIGLSFSDSALGGALILTGCVLLSVAMTLLASALLHKTVLRGAPSAFVMEMPPYRKPRVWQVIVRSLRDRTLFVLLRALAVAAPAGLLLWLLGNVQLGGVPALQYLARLLEVPAALIGLNGAVLLAFLLGSTANELVLPIAMMILTSGTAVGAETSAAMAEILQSCGWDARLSLCTLIFFLFHWPCTTTLLTVKKETGSFKWTAAAALLPTAFGALLCALVNLWP